MEVDMQSRLPDGLGPRSVSLKPCSDDWPPQFVEAEPRAGRSTCHVEARTGCLE